MRAPHLYQLWNVLTLALAGALILPIASRASLTISQRPRGNCHCDLQRHDVGRWQENPAIVHELELSELAGTRGQLDNGRLRVWQYGDGDFDHNLAAPILDEMTTDGPGAQGGLPKSVAPVKNVRRSQKFNSTPKTARVGGEAVTAVRIRAHGPVERGLAKNGRALVFLLALASQLKSQHQ